MRPRLVVASLALLMSFAVSLGFPPSIFAQSGDIQLPELSDSSSTGLMVNATNSASFKDNLPAELLSLLQEGQLELEAGRSLKTAPTLPDAWLKGADGAALAGSTGELKTGASFGAGLLFDAAALSAETNQKFLAYKLLWNVQALWALQPALSAAFEFSWFKEGKPYRTLRGEFSRLIPNAIADTKKTAQLFRELIRFTAPTFLKDLSWLTFRFLGNDEDVLWVYSPAIRKVRQLVATNRSDSLLRSAVTPEEFLVWSGKPEAVEAVVEAKATMLVPVLRVELPAQLDKEGCLNVDRLGAVGGKLASRWNYEAGHFPHGAGWVPTTSVFLPRPVWRVAVNSLDPFSSYGKQVLYIDQALSLPVYKFVYNRMGQLWKTVIGVYGISSAKNVAAPLLYPAYTIIVDHLKSEVFVIDTITARSCAVPPPGLSLSDFDPKRFSELEKAAADKPVAAATATPTQEELDEL